MLEFITIITYLTVFLFLLNKGLNNPFFVFSIVFLSSGFIYPSVIFFFIINIYLIFFNNRVDTYRLLFYSFLFLTVSIFYLITDLQFNPIDFIQIIILILLIIFFNPSSCVDIHKEISIGFLTGSLLIFSYYLISVLLGIDYSQENLRFFSVSYTFNYSAIFLFIGFVIAPKVLKLKFLINLLLFLFFLILVFFFQARFIFLFGILTWFLLNVKKNVTNFLFLLLFYTISIYLYLSSDMFSLEDQNNIFTSVINLENTSNNERLEMFLASFDFIKTNPFGAGPGNTEDALNSYGIFHSHAHNMLAHYIFEFGFFGICLYSIIIIKLLSLIKSFNIDLKNILILFVILSSIVLAIQFNAILSIIFILIFFMISKLNEVS